SPVRAVHPGGVMFRQRGMWQCSITGGPVGMMLANQERESVVAAVTT
ncbi:MAG: hypothetical protein K0R13_2608, partial [Propionibacteriaceae bacterium]|nr:hypothetical protein [Propionibacteriaceae bacterium]